MRRRLLTLLVAAVTAVTMLSGTAFAAEEIAPADSQDLQGGAAVTQPADPQDQLAEDPAEDPAADQAEDSALEDEAVLSEDPGTEQPGDQEEPPEEPPVQTGWNEDHTQYIGEDGNPYTGKHKIDGEYYYFNSKGILQTGWKKLSGKYYYFSAKADGAAVKGRKKIGGKLYFFNENTAAARSKGFFKDKAGNEYYSTSAKGKLAKGWKALKYKKKLYGFYFSKKTGKMAKGTTVGYLKIPKNGRLHRAYALGIKTLNKHGWSLKAAYKYSYKTKYYDRWYRVGGKNRSEKYSIRGFEKHKGNCYVMGATFYVMAKLLGYNVRQVYGKIDMPHSWTEIKQGGKIYVYDPNFRNETGRNGWKIYYGKKGTWRYHKQGNLNSFVKKGKFK